MRHAASCLAVAAALAVAGCGTQPAPSVARPVAPGAQPGSARPPAPAWRVDPGGQVACATTTRLPARGRLATYAVELAGSRATLTGRVGGDRWLPSLRHPRLTLASATGSVSLALHAARYVPGARPPYLPGALGHAAGHWSTLCLARFDSGPPTAVTAAYAGGAHCCTRLHLLDESGTSSLETGNVGASLRLVDGDLLLQTGDDRFSYAFSDFADSCAPVQLLQPRDGGFRDVTGEHPEVLRADARAAWRLAHRRDVRLGFLACWAADEDRLGDDAQVWSTLDRLDARGFLRLRPDLRGMWPDGAAYLTRLRSFLTQHGYRPAA